MANSSWQVVRLILLVGLITSCATPTPSTSNVQPPISKSPNPNPRPPTVKPTDDTPQPPTAIITPSPFPKEANGKIAAPAWSASDEVLKEFKVNGGAVVAVVAASEIKVAGRWSTAVTLDNKIHNRAFSTVDIPAQFIGLRSFNIGGYRAPLIGEVSADTDAAILYFINLTDNTVLPITFAFTYEDRFNYGGYSWLELNTDFFSPISKFTPTTPKDLSRLLQPQIGKVFRVSPAVLFDWQTAEAFINKYAPHSSLYKVDGMRSAICSSPTLQRLSPAELLQKNLPPPQIWETFQADGTLPPCLGLIQKR